MSRRVLQAAMTAMLLAACQSEGVRSAKRLPPNALHGHRNCPVQHALGDGFPPGSGRPLLDAALVTEKEGRLWLIDSKDGRRWPVAGVPAVKVAGQGGLGDVAVHPNSSSTAGFT